MACLVLLVILCATLQFVVHEATHFTKCSQLPYPELCKDSDYGFRESNFKNAVKYFKDSHHQCENSVNLTAITKREREAWMDCFALINETISKVGRCMKNVSEYDSQTWLSAALADQITCRNGFTDFNLSVPWVLSLNMTKILSNSLAINKANIGSSSSVINGGNRRLLADGFPYWVSPNDRWLLGSSNDKINADLVVAKDGSGDYKTINDAVKASKSGSKRFVIHVKAGVYSENVEVTKSMKNLMIVGDGIGKTIVTGKKNVVDGSTTFGSATLSKFD